MRISGRVRDSVLCAKVATTPGRACCCTLEPACRGEKHINDGVRTNVNCTSCPRKTSTDFSGGCGADPNHVVQWGLFRQSATRNSHVSACIASSRCCCCFCCNTRCTALSFVVHNFSAHNKHPVFSRCSRPKPVKIHHGTNILLLCCNYRGTTKRTPAPPRLP